MSNADWLVIGFAAVILISFLQAILGCLRSIEKKLNKLMEK